MAGENNLDFASITRVQLRDNTSVGETLLKSTLDELLVSSLWSSCEACSSPYKLLSSLAGLPVMSSHPGVASYTLRFRRGLYESLLEIEVAELDVLFYF